MASSLPAAAETTAVSEFKTGMWVALRGLVKQPQLNGVMGKLKDFDPATGRWGVRLIGHEDPIRALPVNLAPVSDPAANINAELRRIRAASSASSGSSECPICLEPLSQAKLEHLGCGHKVVSKMLLDCLFLLNHTFVPQGSLELGSNLPFSPPPTSRFTVLAGRVMSSLSSNRKASNVAVVLAPYARRGMGRAPLALLAPSWGCQLYPGNNTVY